MSSRLATDKTSRGEPVWQAFIGEGIPLEQAAALAREIEEEPQSAAGPRLAL